VKSEESPSTLSIPSAEIPYQSMEEGWDVPRGEAPVDVVGARDPATGVCIVLTV
jgi:hypothetical protein